MQIEKNVSSRESSNPNVRKKSTKLNVTVQDQSQSENEYKKMMKMREEFEAREDKKNKQDFVTYMMNILTKPEVI